MTTDIWLRHNLEGRLRIVKGIFSELADLIIVNGKYVGASKRINSPDFMYFEDTGYGLMSQFFFLRRLLHPIAPEAMGIYYSVGCWPDGTRDWEVEEGKITYLPKWENIVQKYFQEHSHMVILGETGPSFGRNRNGTFMLRPETREPIVADV